MTDPRALALFYIADGPRLEVQSWLLAASLAHAHAGDARVRQIAYVGAAHRPLMAEATHAIYAACGVELRDLPDPPAWRRPYPHGNKIVAAAQARGTSHAIFLDTDMACLESLAGFLDLPPGMVAAAPEGRPTWGAEGDRWPRAYAHFGLPFPTERVRLLRGNRALFVPYYNAGFIAFSEAPHGADGRRFGQHWLDTALDFDRTCAIGQKRPWLDQITLPLTLARFGHGIRVLDERHNYSLSNRADYARTPDVAILHYHRNRFLAQAPQWPALRARLFDLTPASVHGALADHVRAVEAAPEPSGAGPDETGDQA